MRGGGPDRRLLARARRRITVQVAGAISVLLAVAGTVVYCVVANDQDTSARREVAAAAHRASIEHPPPCVWLFETRAGAVHASPGAPAALPTRAPIARAAAGLEPQVGRERIAGRTYLVHTQRRGDTVVQVAMDLRYQAAERRRLLRTLAGVEAAGLLAALLIGQFAARRAIAPLGEALARQRRFTAEVSHELRTPLTRLHTRTQLLARRLRGGTDVGPEMEQLVAGTRQLAEVVEDLLLSAELGRPGRPGRPFPLVDLAVLAEEQVAAEAPRAAARGVTIEVRRQGAVHVVRGAESALRRVISALLDNALGHTAGHIWLTLSAGPETVQVTVQDDGAGLDGRDTERLFIRYVRGERAEPRGFGLGLALAREVVDGHGGTITAHCPPGTGAVFTVRLPAARSRCD